MEKERIVFQIPIGMIFSDNQNVHLDSRLNEGDSIE